VDFSGWSARVDDVLVDGQVVPGHFTPTGGMVPCCRVFYAFADNFLPWCGNGQVNPADKVLDFSPPLVLSPPSHGIFPYSNKSSL